MYETKFRLGEFVDIKPEPGHTGEVIMIDLMVKPHRYLLDCSPGACSNYVWLKHPKGFEHGGETGIIAANWFEEQELETMSNADVASMLKWLLKNCGREHSTTLAYARQLYGFSNVSICQLDSGGHLFGIINLNTKEAAGVIDIRDETEEAE